MHHQLNLKKKKILDGFPVIREAENNDDEEVSSTMDIEEIDRLARYVYTSGQTGSLFLLPVINMNKYFLIFIGIMTRRKKRNLLFQLIDTKQMVDNIKIKVTMAKI